MFRTIRRARLSTAGATGLVGVLALGVIGVLGMATPAAAAEAERTALLSARQMPAVNEVQDWARVARRSTRVSNAQPGPISALGATDRARRDFTLPGASASSVVLTFDTSDEAAQAYTEVRSWRQHAGDNVPDGGRLLFTSKHTPVAVDSGRGSYFSFVYKSDRDSEEGTFEWLGVTRRGTAVSIVAWRVDGQDATYEVDPTIASVQAANTRLARLG